MSANTKNITKSNKVEKKKVVKVVVADRSAYNCVDCSGFGLATNTKVCPACKGTGKK